MSNSPTLPSALSLFDRADVVDSSDAERMDEAREELHGVLSDDEMRDCTVLILANKQDLPRALSVSDIASKLRMKELRHSWFIQPACAVSGEGLHEGLDWLARELRKSRK